MPCVFSFEMSMGRSPEFGRLRWRQLSATNQPKGFIDWHGQMDGFSLWSMGDYVYGLRPPVLLGCSSHSSNYRASLTTSNIDHHSWNHTICSHTTILQTIFA